MGYRHRVGPLYLPGCKRRQRLQPFQHSCMKVVALAAFAADLRDGLESAAACENCQPSEQQLLLLREQGMAPINGCPQCSLPGRHIDVATSQQRQAVLQPPCHHLGRSLSVDALTTAATVVFAGTTLALAYVRFMPLLLLSMLAGGMAWMAMMSSLSVAVQTAAPAWVRSRALAMWLLVFQGMMAIGSFGWSAVAEQFGSGTALAFAA